MATLREYVLLADDVYDSWTDSGPAPAGWTVPPGMFQDDSVFVNPGSSFGSSGLQCRTYRRAQGTEAVIAFKGTKLTMGSDIKADLALSFWIKPQQMLDALNLARTWIPQLARDGVQTVTLTGHSLGGAIAQYVGARCQKEKLGNCKGFVTFNAPGMLANTSGLCASPYTAQNLKLGINYIMWGDAVGNFGRHIGDTVRLNKKGLVLVASIAGAGHPIVAAGTSLALHVMGNFKDYLEAKDPKFDPGADPLKDRAS